MGSRINVFIPQQLMDRIRAANLVNVSNLCQQMLDAACAAVETQSDQTLTVTVRRQVSRTLVIQRQPKVKP